MLVNQGLLGIAFFEATAFIILLVLFFIFQRDHINRYFRLWVTGWLVFTLASLCEVAMLSRNLPQLWLAVVMGRVAAMLLFCRRRGAIYDRSGEAKLADPAARGRGAIRSLLFSTSRHARLCQRARGEPRCWQARVCLWAGMVLWRSPLLKRGHGVRLLEGVFLTDRPPRIGPSAVAAASRISCCEWRLTICWAWRWESPWWSWCWRARGREPSN